MKHSIKERAKKVPGISAAKMLEDGINDGRYARILDTINVDISTDFFKAVVEFAEDYAHQSSRISNKRIEKLSTHLKDSIKNKTYQTRFHIACDFPQDKIDIMIDEAVNEYFSR